MASPQHLNETQKETKKKKKKKKERVCIDGGLNKLSLLERHNFVYFNDVTINTSCPYHNFGEND